MLCKKCNQDKALDDFYRKGISHKPSYCKSCFNAYCISRWRKRKQEAVQYMGGKCLDCNSVYPPAVYEFHHLRDKDMSWNKLRLCSWDKIIHELSKCVMLCANCHRIRHYE